MADYRTPLPQMLASLLEAGINQVLVLDPASVDRISRLKGKSLQLDLEGLEITLYLTFEYGNVLIALDSDREPDTVISGTPMALFAMAAPGDLGNWGLPGSSVRISGDANLARDMERIFSRLEPDWQKPLSDMLGDVLGFQIATGLKQGLDALRTATGATAEMMGKYFRDDSPDLARPADLKEFSKAVDALDDATERLQARLRTLSERKP